MAIYKFGSVAISAQATRGLMAMVLAIGVMASLGTFASGGTHTQGFVSKSFNYSLHPVTPKKTAWQFAEKATSGTFTRSDGLRISVAYGTNEAQNKKLKNEWQRVIEPVRTQAGLVQEKIVGGGWQGLLVDGRRKNMQKIDGVDFYLDHEGHYSVWKCQAADKKKLGDCRASVQSLQFLDAGTPNVKR